MKPFMDAGRILFMDDEEDVRLTAGDVLKQPGYAVIFGGIFCFKDKYFSITARRGLYNLDDTAVSSMKDSEIR